MFAKVFEQIFDSSIAQDYTVRHMFIDLLILADPTGAVDMTHDAIARRTNVPTETVQRCITELCQPDVKSRSPLEDGKRLIPLDSHRDWGWKIVNYHHYRKIRDQEARRSYFRDYQRKRRKKLRVVKDTKVDKGEGVELSSSTSSSKSKCTEEELRTFCTKEGLSFSDATYCFNKWESNGWTIGGKRIKDWKAAVRSWKAAGYLPHKVQTQMFGSKPKYTDPNQARLDEEYEQHRQRMERKRAAQA